MSAKIPNDQFLLYAFAGEVAVDAAAAEVLARARGCPDLRLRVKDTSALTYPRWVPGDVDAGQIVVHGLERPDWHGCLDAVARLADEQLDLRRSAWRLHVYGSVDGVPGSVGPSSVAVLQIGHALGDGVRSSALAAVLFGRSANVPAPIYGRSDCLLWRSVIAARTHRALERDTAAGLIPPPAPPRPVRSINSRPGRARTVRTVVRRRSRLRGPTVTVGVLAAVATALSGYLRARGEDASTLGAEVPMAKSGGRRANNHFGNVGVGLYPDVRSDDRARRIAADLDDRRRRGEHPAFCAGSEAMASVPALLVRWGVRQFDADAQSPVVTGNTVVSSVNRGPADLRFGGRPVILTAGYPALSPMMGLTHGVHGIGDTIAISVHAAPSALADVDEYLARLEAALG
jgi:hypothetical protein